MRTSPIFHLFVIIITICNSYVLNATTPPESWKLYVSSCQKQCTIPISAFSNSGLIDSADFIGAFIDSNGTEKCVGLAYWLNNDVVMMII